MNDVSEAQQRKGGTADRYVKQQEIKSEVGIAKVRAGALQQDKAAGDVKTAYYGGTSERQGGVTVHNLDKVANQSKDATQGGRTDAEFGWAGATKGAKGVKKGPGPGAAKAAPPKAAVKAVAPAAPQQQREAAAPVQSAPVQKQALKQPGAAPKKVAAPAPGGAAPVKAPAKAPLAQPAQDAKPEKAAGFKVGFKAPASKVTWVAPGGASVAVPAAAPHDDGKKAREEAEVRRGLGAVGVCACVDSSAAQAARGEGTRRARGTRAQAAR